MSMKSRLCAVERRTHVNEVKIAVFRTMIEGKDGEVEREYFGASILEGPKKGTYLEPSDDEDHDQFMAQVERIANGRQSI